MEVQTKTLLHTSLLQDVLTPLKGSHSLYLPGFYEKHIFCLLKSWRLFIFLSWAWACLCILRYWTGARTVTSVLLQVTFNQDYTLLLWQTSVAWAKKVVPTSLLIVPGFIFTVCTGIRVLMNFTFYYSKALSRTHNPSKCYISPRTLKDTGIVVQSTHSSWPSEQLGPWLVAAAQGRPYTTWN